MQTFTVKIQIADEGMSKDEFVNAMTDAFTFHDWVKDVTVVSEPRDMSGSWRKPVEPSNLEKSGPYEPENGGAPYSPPSPRYVDE